MFFFQAEDGIRDLVRSRGLGDVYKRQQDRFIKSFEKSRGQKDVRYHQLLLAKNQEGYKNPVSYTHLTLPTSDLV